MEKLGIDPGVIIFQIINFGILVILLNKFLYKPVLKAIRSKNEALAKIQEDRLLVELDKKSIRETREETLKAAAANKEKILRETRMALETAKKETLAKAENQAKRILEKAEKESRAMKAKLAADYEKDVLSAAVAITEKAMDGELDKKMKAKVFQIASLVLKDKK